MRKLLLFTAALLIVSNLYGQDLVILHVNDTHSQIDVQSSGRSKGFGGFIRRANYISYVRSQHNNVLLFDAGDYNQGTPYFTLFKGDLEIDLNNNIGLDVACLGNHEFDNGQEELARRLAMANYPTICANYDFSNSPLKDYVKPYVILEKGGKRIGIIGVLIDINGYVSAKSRANVVYKNPIAVVNKLAKQLKKKEKCDLIVVLSHLGFEAESKSPSDKELAAASKNVDLIIGGHSHTFLESSVEIKNASGKRVIVTQAGAYGVYVGRFDLTF